jgi:6-pyruvoyltetrahydropterin/6-carboxytetrahydropterin synthase
MSNRTQLARRRGFQCTHRYEVQAWDATKNRANFGACFSPTGHGHNYELEAYFEGPLDPETGMILNLADVDLLLAEVLAPLDGKHLNFEVPEFKDRVPTTEAIAGYIFSGLERAVSKFAGVKLSRVRLYEYDDLWVDVWPS